MQHAGSVRKVSLMPSGLMTEQHHAIPPSYGWPSWGYQEIGRARAKPFVITRRVSQFAVRHQKNGWSQFSWSWPPSSFVSPKNDISSKYRTSYLQEILKPTWRAISPRIAYISENLSCPKGPYGPWDDFRFSVKTEFCLVITSQISLFLKNLNSPILM